MQIVKNLVISDNPPENREVGWLKPDSKKKMECFNY